VSLLRAEGRAPAAARPVQGYRRPAADRLDLQRRFRWAGQPCALQLLRRLLRQPSHHRLLRQRKEGRPAERRGDGRVRRSRALVRPRTATSIAVSCPRNTKGTGPPVGGTLMTPVRWGPAQQRAPCSLCLPAACGPTQTLKQEAKMILGLRTAI